MLLIESKFCLNHVGNEDKFLLTMNYRAKDQVSELYPVVSSAYSLSAMFETLQFTSFMCMLNNKKWTKQRSLGNTCFDTFLFRKNTLNLYTLATFLQIRLVAVDQKP